MPRALIHCIADLLKYDPAARLTSEECCNHLYLADTNPFIPTVPTSMATVQPPTAAMGHGQHHGHSQQQQQGSLHRSTGANGQSAAAANPQGRSYPQVQLSPPAASNPNGIPHGASGGPSQSMSIAVPHRQSLANGNGSVNGSTLSTQSVTNRNAPPSHSFPSGSHQPPLVGSQHPSQSQPHNHTNSQQLSIRSPYGSDSLALASPTSVGSSAPPLSSSSSPLSPPSAPFYSEHGSTNNSHGQSPASLSNSSLPSFSGTQHHHSHHQNSHHHQQQYQGSYDPHVQSLSRQASYPSHPPKRGGTSELVEKLGELDLPPNTSSEYDGAQQQAGGRHGSPSKQHLHQGGRRGSDGDIEMADSKQFFSLFALYPKYGSN